MTETEIDPWHHCQRDRRETIRPVLFLLCYRFCMSMERRKREKVRNMDRVRDILRTAALAAGILAGAGDKESARFAREGAEDFKTEQVSRSKNFSDFRRSNNIEDRRFQHMEDAPQALTNARQEAAFAAEKTPDSELAADAGIHDIERSPADILRERMFKQGKELLKKEILRKRFSEKRGSTS